MSLQRLRSLVIGLMFAATLSSAAAARPASAVAVSAFPCRWNYDLHVGLRAGYVTGGESADCTGQHGTLTLRTQLYRWIPAKRKWRLDRSASRSWLNPTGNRFVTFQEHCARGKVRATFSWVLRDGSRHVIAQNSIQSTSVADPGPGCAYALR
jgi:hypothetical protein